MKRISRILSALILISCLITIFAACKDKSAGIQSGSYYQVDHEERYIVISDETIALYNFDYSSIEETIFDAYGESVDVSKILTGEQPYDTSKKKDEIFVYVYKGLCLTLHYDRVNNTISYGEQKYVLREA